MAQKLEEKLKTASKVYQESNDCVEALAAACGSEQKLPRATELEEDDLCRLIPAAALIVTDFHEDFNVEEIYEKIKKRFLREYKDLSCSKKKEEYYCETKIKDMILIMEHL